MGRADLGLAFGRAARIIITIVTGGERLNALLVRATRHLRCCFRRRGLLCRLGPLANCEEVFRLGQAELFAVLYSLFELLLLVLLDLNI